METKQEAGTQETQVQEALPQEVLAQEAVTTGEGGAARLRRPPRRPDGSLTAGSRTAVESRLKSERVEERLRQMPGWKLQAGGRVIDRVRDLVMPDIAADYAAWVLKAGGLLGRSVGVRLIDGRYLAITIEGRSGPNHRSLSEADLHFAQCLG